MLVAKINFRELDCSVAGEIHPVPEVVGAQNKNKNLKTRHRIPAETTAKHGHTQRTKNPACTNQAAQMPVSPSL